MKKQTLKPKPKPQRMTYIDFSEATSYIEQKYDIDTRDYAHSSSQFFEWCDEKGYTDKYKGKPRSESQELFALYQSEINDGTIKERPYQDFWHWLTDVADIHRGATTELRADMGEGAEPWQQHILGLYLKEFGEGPYLTDW